MKNILRLIIVFCLVGVSISFIGLYFFNEIIKVSNFELVENIEFRSGKFINKTSIPIGYKIEINYPDVLEIQNDAEISIKVIKIKKIKNKSSRINIKFSSNSFKITPKSELDLEIKNNAEESIVITAKNIGNKKIHIYSEYLKNKNKVIEIEVIDRKTFVGITENNLNLINKVSIILGFPSLLVFIFGKLLAYRKNYKKEKIDKIKIYIPKQGGRR